MSHKYAEECPVCGAEIEVEVVLESAPDGRWPAAYDVPDECPECGARLERDSLQVRAVESVYD